MPDVAVDIAIPNRALFKASEVCDILKVQPYVLRTWEAEFPELGVSKTAGAARIYRRKDVQQVARIKHLLLIDGLTLAGARRKLEEEMAPVGANAPAIDELIGRNARERLTTIKRGLRSILELLASGGVSYRQSTTKPAPVAHVRSMGDGRRRGTKSPPRGKPTARPASGRTNRARRKRSA